MCCDALDRFLSEHKDSIEMPEGSPDCGVVRDMLLSIDVPRADDLEYYLVFYGRLSMGAVAFYGMERDGHSDMRDVTEELHRDFCMTDGYAALESLGDGTWALCDGHGRIFRFDSDSRMLTDLRVQLREYILGRFQDELAEAGA